MKKVVMSIAVCLAALFCGAIDADELVTLALKDVVGEAGKSIAAAPVPKGQAIAVLPLAGDDGDGIKALVKNALTAAGKTCVEGKEDPMWDEILKEIAWDERKEDILDKSTVDKFGKIKSAQFLLYGGCRRLAVDKRYVLVEIELHLTSIATKEHVWGGTFAKRLYAPGEDPKGIIDIPAEIRRTLRGKLSDKIAASLKASSKIGGVKKVVCLPLAGDIDQYVEGIVRDVVSASSLTPVNMDVRSRAEARFALREGPAKADAILYGALRDLSPVLKETLPNGERTYSAEAEVQLWVEKGVTREVLWSDTVAASEPFKVGAGSWWDQMKYVMPWLRPWMLVAIPVGLVVLLVVLSMFFKAVTRVR